jgi:hypothetical protein
MTVAGQFFNVFSVDEITNICSELNKLSNQSNQGEFFAYTNGFSRQDLIYPFIKKVVISKLEILIGKKINLTVGMLLKAQIPWLIHTDYVKNDQHPDLALLIPLMTANTHTVVFEQKCVDSFGEFIKTNKKLDNNAKNLHTTLCSHESLDRLEYVSLYDAYKWYLGSVIYWDRKMLHCSDNFLKNDLTEKNALVLFTNHSE